MLTAPSLARSESFARSKVSPRLIEVSGTKFSSPSTEVFVSGNAPFQVSNSEYAQTGNLNHQTSRPFVLGKAPRGAPHLVKKEGGVDKSASERPSTSGGTSAAAPSTSWDRSEWGSLRKKRESKDDTYFALMKGNKVERSEIIATSFHMPTALPTPDATPPRGPSPEEPLIGRFVEMNYHDQNGSGIGMALGSPTHPQHDWGQPPYRVNTNNTTLTNDQSQEAKRPGDVVSPAKQKQSKWKGFGSLFGRKGPKQASNFYGLDGSPPSGNSPEIEQHGTFGNGNPTPPDSADWGTRARSNTTSKKPAKRAPIPTRANTAPVQSWRGNKNAEKKDQQPPEIQVDGGPMLDVEIPSIHLDRYSVMFSGVLGKGGVESSRSLLARRQATLDKLKTVNEAIAEAEKEREDAEVQKKLRGRRATSPQPTKSPAFSLFPSATVATPSHPVPRTPTPLADQLRPSNKLGHSRSNTSPAALSPNRSTFHSDAESHIIMLDDGKALLNGISSRSASKKTVQFSAQESTLMLSPQSMDSSSLPSSPNVQPSRGRRLQADQRTSPNDTEESGQEEEEPRARPPMKPKFSEPDWQIINPSESESESGPFRKEIELIDRITSPTSGTRGRSRTITQQSATPSTISTANSSILASPSSDHQHPMSPLRSNPPSPHPYALSQTTSPEPHLQHSTSTSSSNTTSTSFTTPSSTSPPRRARSIKQIRADLENRQRSASRSAQREAQREAERAKVQAELDEAERTLESAAGLSIARQISMSQKQRQLLLPIQTRSMSSNSVNSNGSTGIYKKASGSTVSATGLGNNRENDAILLSSGGFNNPMPISSPGARSVVNGGFDFSHYERPHGYQTERPDLSRQRSGSIKQERPELSRQRSGSINQEHERERAPSRTERAPSRTERAPSRTERAPSRTERAPSRTERAPSRAESQRAPSRTGLAMGSSTMSAGADANGRIHSTINMGAMGMGAVLKREISSGTPTVVEPDYLQVGGKGFGHRYQRSERVILDG